MMNARHTVPGDLRHVCRRAAAVRSTADSSAPRERAGHAIQSAATTRSGPSWAAPGRGLAGTLGCGERLAGPGSSPLPASALYRSTGTGGVCATRHRPWRPRDLGRQGRAAAEGDAGAPDAAQREDTISTFRKRAPSPLRRCVVRLRPSPARVRRPLRRRSAAARNARRSAAGSARSRSRASGGRSPDAASHGRRRTGWTPHADIAAPPAIWRRAWTDDAEEEVDPRTASRRRRRSRASGSDLAAAALARGRGEASTKTQAARPLVQDAGPLARLAGARPTTGAGYGSSARSTSPAAPRVAACRRSTGALRSPSAIDTMISNVPRSRGRGRLRGSVPTSTPRPAALLARAQPAEPARLARSPVLVQPSAPSRATRSSSCDYGQLELRLLARSPAWRR